MQMFLEFVKYDEPVFLYCQYAIVNKFDLNPTLYVNIYPGYWCIVYHDKKPKRGLCLNVKPTKYRNYKPNMQTNFE